MFKVVFIIQKTQTFKLVRFDLPEKTMSVLKEESKQTNLNELLNDDIFLGDFKSKSEVNKAIERVFREAAILQVETSMFN